MREKILRTQVCVLFLFTLLSGISFYFRESLPDHFLAISSDNLSTGFINYTLTSWLVGVEYFSGTWLVFPFLFFSITYGLSLIHRPYTLDLLLLVPILVFFLMLNYLFFPLMLGEGLGQLLRENIKWPYDQLVAILAFSTMLTGYFRISLLAQIGRSGQRFTQLLKRLRGNSDLASSPVTNSFQRDWFNWSPKVGQKLETASDQEAADAEASAAEVVDQPTSPPPSPPAMASSPPAFRELMACICSEDLEAKSDPQERYFREIVEKIEDKLAEFNVDAKIIHILKGPVVDTFELELGEGVRVARVTSLAQDIGLALKGIPLRIIYPMEGKTTVGMEVPRTPREVIFLHQILGSRDFQEERRGITLALGKNAFGDPYVVDLTQMPHMLVAGATGAGKSVFINTLLVSILVKMPPERLKLILIDPKQLELALYRKLPHLAMPVVTDPSRATISLMWAVEEMERRYNILAQLEVRSIDGFNEKVRVASPETLSAISPLYPNGREQTIGYQLPYLVIIIDEFADLILSRNGKTIENNICRLAAKARACGIHLIIATQRPSVDVITGLIKANFPTRVSFRVTAGQDSRTILNSAGAESLLGKGDMLYKHGIEMKRLHSAYVDEEQIARLVAKIARGEPTFLKNAMEYLSNSIEGREGGLTPMAEPGDGQVFDEIQDPLYPEAVKIVLEHRTASASMLQRRLKVGYNRAANLIDTMEACGVIGAQQGSRPRQVLNDSMEQGSMGNLP